MGFKQLTPENVKYIVVHCSASQPKADIDVKTIDRWHRQRGFAKVGYHYVIKTDGTVEEGRKLSEPGAHAQGYNANSIGICLVGGVDKEGRASDNFTAAQKHALHGLLMGLSHTYTAASILGHRDLPGVKKDCPCFDVRDWLKDVEQTA